MDNKPTYEELEQRLRELEQELAAHQACRDSVPRQEQYFKAILDNTNLPIYLKDAAYRYLFINREFERLAGVSCAAIRGKDDFEVFPEPVARLFRDQDEEVRQRNGLAEFKETIPLADGVHVFLTAKFPLHDAAGKVYAIGGVCTDITALQKAEDCLRESEERYRSFIENFHGIAYRGVIPTFTPIFFHGAVAEITGYREEDFVAGRPRWDQVVHPEDLPLLIADNDIRHTPGHVFRREYRIIRRDGEIRWIFERGTVLGDGRGEAAWVEGSLFDITGRKIMEQALRDREEKLKSIIDSCPEGILLYTLAPDGRLLFAGANPAADTILQVDCARFLGKTVDEAFPGLSETELPEIFREICRTGRAWQTENFTYADQQVQGAFAVHAFQTGANRMAVFFRDITTRQRLELEMQKIQKLESVGILAGGIAHDFNNLLTAILGNISMAKLFARTEPAKVLERLTDAENASLRARDLTQQLLTFAKGGAPVKSSADLGEIIRASTSFMLSGSNVRCENLLPEDLWPVEIDVGQISQVIQNVVKNGDQAMPEGGTITILAANAEVAENDGLPLRPGNYVHLSIVDQGVGIPRKHLTRIFDPYFSTKQEGSGLGLAACHSIIKNHDGLIYAESDYGSGAAFHIYLPAAREKPAPKQPLPRQSLRSGEYILIMDDDDDVLLVAENMLNLMGFRTATARDGAQAIVMYKQAMDAGQPFDGILLDLTIPGGLGGRETVKQLALLDPEVRAVVSSGYANDQIMADYEAHGFRGVVSKPYDMEQLGQVFRDLFDQPPSRS